MPTLPQRGEEGTMKPKVYIAIPNLGFITTNLMLVMMEMKKHPWVGEVQFPQNLVPVAYARNWCTMEFLKTDCTHLWFVDADVEVAMKSMEFLVEAKVPVVCGVVCTMQMINGEPKVAPVTFLYHSDGCKAYFGSGVEKIDGCGAACLMIEREVVEKKIEFPWFEEKPWGPERSEDLNFCAKLRGAGVPLYAHFEVTCRHWKTIPI